MRRGNNSVMEGKVYEAAPSTAHTLAPRTPRTPPGYHFDVDSGKDCLLPLFDKNPRAYYTQPLLEVTLAEIRKRREARAAAAVCYPQDSIPLTAGQEVAS